MNVKTAFGTNFRRSYLLNSVVLLLGLCGVHIAQAQVRYSISADGSEVSDSKTGLIWRRCSEGQTWSAGNCTGPAATYSHEQALAQAKTQIGWRLPNVKELSSIADRTRSNPTIDVITFPTTLSDKYWTSTPFAGVNYDKSYLQFPMALLSALAPYGNCGYCAWVVDFGTGEVVNNGRSNTRRVRLVR